MARNGTIRNHQEITWVQDKELIKKNGNISNKSKLTVEVKSTKKSVCPWQSCYSKTFSAIPIKLQINLLEPARTLLFQLKKKKEKFWKNVENYILIATAKSPSWWRKTRPIWSITNGSFWFKITKKKQLTIKTWFHWFLRCASVR